MRQVLQVKNVFSPNHDSSFPLLSVDIKNKENAFAYPTDSFHDNTYRDGYEDNSFKFQQENMMLTDSKKQNIDLSKFKTEMCKNWEENGRCNYGRKCKFAHGKHELMDKALVNKDRYKSKCCNTFHTEYYCPYGSRCLFIHQNKKLQDIIKFSFFRRKLHTINFAELIESETNNCSSDLMKNIRIKCSKNSQ